jgi:hypothetical protein
VIEIVGGAVARDVARSADRKDEIEDASPGFRSSSIGSRNESLERHLTRGR